MTISAVTLIVEVSHVSWPDALELGHIACVAHRHLLVAPHRVVEVGLYPAFGLHPTVYHGVLDLLDLIGLREVLLRADGIDVGHVAVVEVRCTYPQLLLIGLVHEAHAADGHIGTLLLVGKVEDDFHVVELCTYDRKLALGHLARIDTELLLCSHSLVIVVLGHLHSNVLQGLVGCQVQLERVFLLGTQLDGALEVHLLSPLTGISAQQMYGVLVIGLCLVEFLPVVQAAGIVASP